MYDTDIVLCDFDGTITKVDVINDFLEKFADKSWLDWENLWRKGKIGSKELLKEQFALVRPIDDKTFYEYLSEVELDEYFKDFYLKAKKHDLKIVVVSDGFDLFIDEILKLHGIELEVYANFLKLENGKFYPSFPERNRECKVNAGNCKCEVLKKFKKIYNTVYYVGDGVSDYCVAKEADILFAKNELSTYCLKNKTDFILYSDFKEVMNNDKFGIDFRH